jgi:hypothetical protein
VEPLYLGGLPSYYEVSDDLGFTRGFVGCISRLGLGRTDITRTREKRVGVTGCETCAQNPCTNGGLCQESSSPTGYVCLCPQVGGFTHGVCIYGASPNAHSWRFCLRVILRTFRWRGEGEVVRDKAICKELWKIKLDLNSYILKIFILALHN